ncbi:hypothetical protein [Candidatus Hodgkinia cicadicola]|uniref:hypothetical protein n=1 Tax=Candidatus Hodgkinia cicadicola TaxID=573658 RepID=UPI001788DAF5
MRLLSCRSDGSWWWLDVVVAVSNSLCSNRTDVWSELVSLMEAEFNWLIDG